MGAPIVQMGWHHDGLLVRLHIFPCTIKSRRWQAVMEEVDKGCSGFCLIVGTVTRTASILIRSRLKALAVNLSQPTSVVCWLKWVSTALTGSKQTSLSVRIFLLLFHGCEWVNVSSGTGSPK